MQKTPDESDRGTASAEAGGAGRLDTNPDEVVLRGGGWAGNIARFTGRLSCLTVSLPRYKVSYMRLAADALVFEQAAAVLVVEGMMMQDLLQDTRIEQGSTLWPGPFLLLGGVLSPAWDPPMRLQNICLAQLREFPADMTRETLFGILLHDALHVGALG